MYHPKETMKVIGEKGTKALRLFRSTLTFHASSTPDINLKQKRPEIYTIAGTRMNEIETERALVRVVSNSDKWKSGGAY